MSQDSAASSEPTFHAIKIASNSQTALNSFAVEAVAASQVRDMAQQVSHWHGRALLPLVHGVGIGGVAKTSLPPEVAQDPAMLVMQLADGTLKDRKFEGEALGDGIMGLGKHTCPVECFQALYTVT